MKEFAKIFNTKYGQILITNDTREGKDGIELPSVNAFFVISEGFGVCELSLKFKLDDADECDKFFGSMDNQKAIDMVEKTILAMR